MNGLEATPERAIMLKAIMGLATSHTEYERKFGTEFRRLVHHTPNHKLLPLYQTVRNIIRGHSR